jgi:hypothetical protein
MSDAELIVHTVHGTWPLGVLRHLKLLSSDKAREGRWYWYDSDFQRDVAKNCDRSIHWVPFEWSGDNSFGARDRAAASFARHLVDWFDRAPGARHCIIAHSHGGSVVVNAVDSLDPNRTGRISCVISIASPFAKLSSNKDVPYVALARYSAFTLGIPCLLVFCSLLWLMKGVFATLVFQSWLLMPVVAWLYANRANFPGRTLLTRDQAPRHDYRNWTLYAVRGPRDEASMIISACQFVNLVAEFFVSYLLIKPFRLALRLLESHSWSNAIAKFMAWTLLLFAAGRLSQWYLYENSQESLFALMFLAPLFALLAPIWIAFFLLAILSILLPLILIPAQCALAAALGWELIGRFRMLTAECEPVPSGHIAITTTVDLDDDERTKAGLVHFLHEAASVRFRVAKLLESS